MRDIIFRGKSVSTLEWVYGSLERRENVDRIGGYEITPPTFSDPLGDTVWVSQVVVRETVGQLLTHRSMPNFYEGDIVGSYGNLEQEIDPETITEVTWDNREEIDATCVLIGNKFDNPELLKP